MALRTPMGLIKLAASLTVPERCCSTLTHYTMHAMHALHGRGGMRKQHGMLLQLWHLPCAVHTVEVTDVHDQKLLMQTGCKCLTATWAESSREQRTQCHSPCTAPHMLDSCAATLKGRVLVLACRPVQPLSQSMWLHHDIHS
ncbi:hypothetical protein V8C86DRAFT_887974 [Haematococcus lacustris]